MRGPQSKELREQREVVGGVGSPNYKYSLTNTLK